MFRIRKFYSPILLFRRRSVLGCSQSARRLFSSTNHSAKQKGIGWPFGFTAGCLFAGGYVAYRYGFYKPTEFVKRLKDSFSEVMGDNTDHSGRRPFVVKDGSGDGTEGGTEEEIGVDEQTKGRNNRRTTIITNNNNQTVNDSPINKRSFRIHVRTHRENRDGQQFEVRTVERFENGVPVTVERYETTPGGDDSPFQGDGSPFGGNGSPVRDFDDPFRSMESMMSQMFQGFGDEERGDERSGGPMSGSFFSGGLSDIFDRMFDFGGAHDDSGSGGPIHIDIRNRDDEFPGHGGSGHGGHAGVPELRPTPRKKPSHPIDDESGGDEEDGN